MEISKAAELETLEDKRDETEYRINDITAQIDKAKQFAQAHGDYADPEWFASVNAARRYANTELGQLNRKIKKLKRDMHDDSSRAWEQAFIRMAKQTLNEETYDRLVALSWEEIGERP